MCPYQIKMRVTCYLCGLGVESEEWTCEGEAGERRHFCCAAHRQYQVSREGAVHPWSVRSHPEYGRYLVASRDIQPNGGFLRQLVGYENKIYG